MAWIGMKYEMLTDGRVYLDMYFIRCYDWVCSVYERYIGYFDTGIVS